MHARARTHMEDNVNVRGECSSEAETGEMYLRAKEHQGFAGNHRELRERPGTDCPLESSDGAWSGRHLASRSQRPFKAPQFVVLCFSRP